MIPNRAVSEVANNTKSRYGRCLLTKVRGNAHAQAVKISSMPNEFWHAAAGMKRQERRHKPQEVFSQARILGGG